jgi:hypothetical protein
MAKVLQDRTTLISLIQTEYGQIAQVVALPPLGGITALSPVDTSEIENATQIHPEDYSSDVAKKSLELATLDALVQAAQTGVKSTTFSFLNPDGVISVGFDLGSQIAISKSNVQQIEKKKVEVQGLIAQKIVTVAADFNSALQNYKFSKLGTDSTKSRISWLIERHLQGDDTLNDEGFVDGLVGLEQQEVQFLANEASAVQLYLGAKSRLDRLTLSGFYLNLEGNQNRGEE